MDTEDRCSIRLVRVGMPQCYLAPGHCGDCAFAGVSPCMPVVPVFVAYSGPDRPRGSACRPTGGCIARNNGPAFPGPLSSDNLRRPAQDPSYRTATVRRLGVCIPHTSPKPLPARNCVRTFRTCRSTAACRSGPSLGSHRMSACNPDTLRR